MSTATITRKALNQLPESPVDLSNLASQLYQAKLKKDEAEKEYDSLRQQMIAANPALMDVICSDGGSGHKMLSMTEQTVESVAWDVHKLQDRLGDDFDLYIDLQPKVKGAKGIKDNLKEVVRRNKWKGFWHVSKRVVLKFNGSK
jgi:hypothetical protein